ncbi:deacetylase [Achromatium sp. WMS3]|nr:deacetylase [Achromatium sp. WMS3]
MTVAIITHPQCYKHDMGTWHPETPTRITAVETALKTSDIKTKLQFYEAPEVTYEQLARTHTTKYLHKIESMIPNAESDRINWIDSDTGIMAETVQAATRAAGASVLATDLVLNNTHKAAFCAIRPPGHHAGADYAMGFCYYNNLAVAVNYALAQYQLDRIAIIDFDVHHGNGTEDIVANDPRILFCSSFQHPFYPYRGANSVATNVSNLPLPAGTDGAAYQSAVQIWFSKLEQFKPQIIFFSAGFDGHAEDRIAMFQLQDVDFVWLTTEIQAIAAKYGAGIVSCLEGGYNQAVLGGSVVAHVQALFD